MTKRGITFTQSLPVVSGKLEGLYTFPKIGHPLFEREVLFDSLHGQATVFNHENINVRTADKVLHQCFVPIEQGLHIGHGTVRPVLFFSEKSRVVFFHFLDQCLK